MNATHEIALAAYLTDEGEALATFTDVVEPQPNPLADTDSFGIDECPVCEDPLDYCQGHGEIGDPRGYALLQSYYRTVYGA